MITDIEMGALNQLENLCKDRLSKQIVGVVQEMLGELDANGFASDEVAAEFMEQYASGINDIISDAAANDTLPKRKIGDYEITNSFKYGDKEVFFGENPTAVKAVERYVVGDIVANELFEQYVDVVGCDNYNEAAEIYAQRTAAQVERINKKLDSIPFDRSPIGQDACDSISGVDLEGKIIVIDPKAIKKEYVGADRQLCVAEDGFGCSPSARGRKVYCKNIFTGQKAVWYREDVLGTLKPDHIPEWVQARITDNPIEVLFTFGSSEQFPFQMGYVSITAPSVKEAIAEFRRNYPDKNEGTLNCADYYYKEDSVAEIKEHGNGAGCHKTINITLSTKVASVSNLIAKAEQTCEEINNEATAKSDVEKGKS